MGEVAIDDKKYSRVLARTLPRILQTAEDHLRALSVVEELMDAGSRRTVEEDAVLELMVRLIQDYEEKHHPLSDPTPHEMLVYLMEQRGLKQADLLDIFTSRGYVSDVVNGKRAISRTRARKLADFFRVSVDVFV